MADEFNIPLLAQIPIVQSICEAGDAGSPAALQQDTPQANAFTDAAQKLAQTIAMANANTPEVVAQF